VWLVGSPSRYEFLVDPAEQARASAVVKRNHWLQRYNWSAAAGAVLYGGWNAMTGGYLGVTVVALLGGAVLAALHFLAPAFEARQLRRMLASVPGLDQPHVYTFSDAGLEMTGGPRTVSLRWDGIVSVGETREFFLFYVAKNWAHYLPKRVIGGSERESELREFVESKTGRPVAQAG
jgi:hypothetical protein